MTNKDIKECIEQTIINATEFALSELELPFGTIEFTTDEHGDFANAQGELIDVIYNAIISRQKNNQKRIIRDIICNLSDAEKLKLHELYVNGSEAYDIIHPMSEFDNICKDLRPHDIAELCNTQLFDINDSYFCENEEHGLYSFTEINFGELPFDALDDYSNFILNYDLDVKTEIKPIDEYLSIIKGVKK